jgi:non-specific serine/threonine protein kinase
LPTARANVLDILASLVDKSLVTADEQDGTVRYRMLEIVRQYAGERLAEAGEVAEARDRHLDWCLALAQAAEAEFRGPGELAWLARLEQEHDNVRAALSWALHHRPAAAVRLAADLPHFWDVRCHVREGRRWLEQALTAGTDAPPALRARALAGAGLLADMHGDFAAARAHYQECLDLYQELDDQRGIAEAQGELGRTAVRQGDYAAARPFLEASLALHLELGHKPGVARVQGALGVLALRQGDPAASRALGESRLALWRELGNRDGIADALDDLAAVASHEGDTDRQVALLEESLALWRELGNQDGIAVALGDLGIALWARGDHERAAALLDESLALYRQLGAPRGTARLLGYQGWIALTRREYDRAAALGRESLALYRQVGDIWAIGRHLALVASAVFGLGWAERAARLFGAATLVQERLGTPLSPLLQSGCERTVAAIRRSLGEEAFGVAWAAGQALPLDDALDEALDEALSEDESPSCARPDQ